MEARKSRAESGPHLRSPSTSGGDSVAFREGSWLQEVILCPTLPVMPAPSSVLCKLLKCHSSSPPCWRVPIAVQQMGEPRHRGGLCLNPDLYCEPIKCDLQVRS